MCVYICTFGAMFGNFLCIGEKDRIRESLQWKLLDKLIAPKEQRRGAEQQRDVQDYAMDILWGQTYRLKDLRPEIMPKNMKNIINLKLKNAINLICFLMAHPSKPVRDREISF